MTKLKERLKSRLELYELERLMLIEGWDSLPPSIKNERYPDLRWVILKMNETQTLLRRLP